MKEIPYRAELKKLYDEKILRISLISFIEKSCGNPKRTGLPIKAKKEYIL